MNLSMKHHEKHEQHEQGDEELLPSQRGYGNMNKLRRDFPSLPSIFQDLSLKVEIG